MSLDLTALGFSSFFGEQLQDPDAIVARVAAEHRGGYDVWAADGEGRAQLTGRLARELESSAGPGVGDWVTLSSQASPDQVVLVDRVLSRRTVFTRGAAGRTTRQQVVAANVDLVFVVCGLDSDFNLRRIERYLARVWAGGAEPVVVLNKADVCDSVAERVAETRLSAAGASVLACTALASDGLDELASMIRPGITAALVGSSGAGKSTIINALVGDERMATRAVRHRDGRGCHTTTHRQLIALPAGGLLVDTPGMRELQLVDEDGIDAVFSDIADLAQGCRFGDCRHQAEPGCAIRQAVEAGQLPEARLAHYLKLEAEAQAYELRSDERARRQVDRAFSKRISREGPLARRLKGDKG